MNNWYDFLAQSYNYYSQPDPTLDTKKMLKATLLVWWAGMAYASWANDDFSMDEFFSTPEQISASLKTQPLDIWEAFENWKKIINTASEKVEKLVVSIKPKSTERTDTKPIPEGLNQKQKAESQKTFENDWLQVSNTSSVQSVVSTPKFWVSYQKSWVSVKWKFFSSKIPDLYIWDKQIVFEVEKLWKQNKYYRYIFSENGNAWLAQNCTRYTALRIWYDISVRAWSGSKVASNLISNKFWQVVRWNFKRIKLDSFQQIEPWAIVSIKWEFDHVMVVESIDKKNQVIYTSGMNEGYIPQKNIDNWTYKSATHAWKISIQKFSFDELRSLNPVIAMPSKDAQLKWSQKTVLENFVQTGQQFGFFYPSENIEVSVSTNLAKNNSSEPNSLPKKTIFESQLPNLSYLPQNLALQVRSLGFEPYDIKKDLLNTQKLNDNLTWHVFILDSGHGWIDPGAVFDGKQQWKTIYLTEASANWRDTILMAKYIVSRGWNVYFTQVWPVRFDENNLNFFWNENKIKNLTLLATTPDYKTYYDFNLQDSDLNKQKEIDQRNAITLSVMKQNKTSPITFLSFHKDAYISDNRFSIEVERDDPSSIEFSNSLAKKINWNWIQPSVNLRYWQQQWVFSIWVLREPNQENDWYNMREILIESANLWKDVFDILSDSKTQEKINMIGDALVSSLKQTTASQVASISSLPQNFLEKKLSEQEYKNQQKFIGQKILDFAKSEFDPNDYEYGRPDKSRAQNDNSRVAQDLDWDWKKWLDHSSFVFFVLKKYWYDMWALAPINTTAYWSSWDFDTWVLWKNGQFSNYAINHFEIIKQDFQPWDLLLLENPDWSHHIAFVDHIKDWEITFYWMQLWWIGYENLSNQKIIAGFRIKLEKLNDNTKNYIAWASNISSVSQTNFSTSTQNYQNQNTPSQSSQSFEVQNISSENQIYQNILSGFKSSTSDEFYQNIFSDKNFLDSQDQAYWTNLQQQVLIKVLKQKNLDENSTKFLNSYFDQESKDQINKKVDRIVGLLSLESILSDYYLQFVQVMKQTDYGFWEDRQEYEKAINIVLEKICEKNNLEIRNHIKSQPEKKDVYFLIWSILYQPDELENTFKPEFEKLNIQKLDSQQNTNDSLSEAEISGSENLDAQVVSLNQPLDTSNSLSFDISFEEFSPLTQNFSQLDKSHLKYFDDISLRGLSNRKRIFLAVLESMKDSGKNISSLEDVIEYVKSTPLEPRKFLVLKIWNQGYVRFGNLKVDKNELLNMLDEIKNY